MTLDDEVLKAHHQLITRPRKILALPGNKLELTRAVGYEDKIVNTCPSKRHFDLGCLASLHGRGGT